MTKKNIEIKNKEKLNNDFKINMHFNKNGQTLQRVMESNLIIYYEKAIHSN